MKALVYEEPGKITLADKPKPALQAPGDAMVRVMLTTVRGADLHIVRGDVPTCEPGRTLSHEGVGAVESVGVAATSLQRGGHVLIPCISSCGKCVNCRRGMCSHCETNGWILRHRIDGVQVEYARIPHAEASLYELPPDVDEEALITLSDIFPTGFEYGVLSGRVQPDNSVAIVGAGPIGLTSLLTMQFYSPAQIVTIDTNAVRLEVASRLGATACIDVSREDAATTMKRLTDGVGISCTIEAMDVPATFELCQQLVAPGGMTANIGVHDVKVDLYLEALQSQDVAITTRLIGTVGAPVLLKTVHAGKLLPGQLIAHRFRLDDILTAYDTFHNATRA